MNSRLEQIIAEIEEYIDSCKAQTLSKGKIIVDKDEITELLTELRLKTPDEIKRYQKIIANRDAILADAQARADEVLAQAEIQTNELVSEHQIMQQAYAQANEVVSIATNQAQEILDKATEDANAIRTASIEYTDNLLSNLENIVVHAIDTSREKYYNLLSSLQECYDIVKANRGYLTASGDDASEAVIPEVPADESKSDEINLI
ncbi:MAG: ATPase [Lachnospiraceae bacterium]|nr:ATPase [Lachnospiraceae bacterium]